MIGFNLERKGYNKNEVNQYISKTVSHLESKIEDQNERINQLKEEIDYLYGKNDEYRKNEDKVSSAMITIMDLKRNAEQEIYERNELELERLKLFREKWIAYALEVQKTECNDIINTLNKYMDNFTQEFKYNLKNDLNIRPAPRKMSDAECEYYNEQKRVSSFEGEQAELDINEEESKKLMKMCKNLGLLED